MLADLARRLAPLPVHHLVFTVTPAGDTWTAIGPTPEHAPHLAPNPLRDAIFLEHLARFRDLAAIPLVSGAPDVADTEATLESLARDLGARLTSALLSDAARADVTARLHAVDRGRPRLEIQVAGDSDESDAALALPWELLLPEPTGDFPVKAGLVHLVDDFVRVATAVRPGALHFSGHGLPGRLVFENELGFSCEVKVEDLVQRLRVKLLDRPEGFPRMFFLAACHGAGGSGEGAPGCRADASPEERCAHSRDRAVGQGPSTAAALHRAGFVQVLGYFGPVLDALSTRTEETFYRAVAAGESTLQAVAEARASMQEPLEYGDTTARLPFAWTQLALYHRGEDRALARPGKPGGVGNAPRLQRDEVQVSGMPLLKHGFIGRRSTLHLIRRRLRDGQQLFVIQGLGGLGKTALATHLLAKVMAPALADQVILACGGLDPATMDVGSVLWRQVEEHAERHQVPRWEARARALREAQPESVVGFERAVGCCGKHGRGRWCTPTTSRRCRWGLRARTRRWGAGPRPGSRYHAVTMDAKNTLANIVSRVQRNFLKNRIEADIRLACAGDPVSALDDLEEGLAEAMAAELPHVEASLRVALAQILAESVPFLAGIHLRAALAIAERLSDESGAARIRTMLAALDAIP